MLSNCHNWGLFRVSGIGIYPLFLPSRSRAHLNSSQETAHPKRPRRPRVSEGAKGIPTGALWLDRLWDICPKTYMARGCKE